MKLFQNWETDACLSDFCVKWFNLWWLNSSMVLQYLLMIPLCNFSHKMNYVLDFILKGILFKKRLNISYNCIMNVTFTIIITHNFFAYKLSYAIWFLKLNFVLLSYVQPVSPYHFSLGMIQPNYSLSCRKRLSLLCLK